nr:hypothetical protein [Tanacetum cinerariifolium]
MEGKKLIDLKNKSFDSIQKMFDKALKRVNTFVDFKTELVEESFKKLKAEVMQGSSKRERTELEQESSKKQKIDDDKETSKLKQLVKIIQDEERVAIDDDIPLAIKPPSIIDWKIHKEGRKLITRYSGLMERLDALPPTLFKGYDRDLGEFYTRSGVVRDEIFLQRYRFRSFKQEQERALVTFSAIWRPVLALEVWACQTDAQRASLWHAIYDIQKENHDLRRQLDEERRERLELRDHVVRMEKRQ